MRHNKLSLFVHFVWTTWDRLPLIAPEWERDLHRQLHSEAERHGCKVFGLNGTEDHIHLLVEMPPTISVSALMQRLKGTSSHFVNETLQAREPIKWRASYAAFSVSRWNVAAVARYIQNQKEHHAAGTTKPQLETDD